MNAHSLTAGANHRIYRHRESVYVRVLSGSPIPEMEPNGKRNSASAALQRLGGRVIGTATAKYEVFANHGQWNSTIGVVPVDLERGVPVSNAIAGTGVLPAPSSEHCDQTRQTGELPTN